MNASKLISRLPRLNSLCVLLVVFVMQNAANADVLVNETFSGGGVYSAAGGASGFENPDWFNSGNVGSFTTNGFGEQVYSVSSPANNQYDGIQRLIGPEPVEIIAEFSNPQITGLGLIGMQLTDTPDNVTFFIKNNGGNLETSFTGTANGNNFFPGDMDLGSNVDQFTIRALVQDDTVNGGTMFDFWIDVNESGNFQHVGTIDGTFYTSGHTPGRNIFLGTYAFTGTSSVEIDRLTISSIPEPATFSIFGVAAVGLALSRRRRSSK